ncbi:hypothetical protein MY3296_000249 [Beauveria thailandica]
MSIECVVEEYTGWPIKIAFFVICIFFTAILPHLHPMKFAREMNLTEFKIWIYLLPLIWLYLFLLAVASSLVQTEVDYLHYIIHGVCVLMILSMTSWLVLH